MTDRINSFISGETTLDEISVSELEGLIADFPYADTFKVLLAKKMSNGVSHSLAMQRNDIQLPNFQNEGEIAPEGDIQYAILEKEVVEQIEETADENTASGDNQNIVADIEEIGEIVDDSTSMVNNDETKTMVEVDVEEGQFVEEIVSLENNIIVIENDTEELESDDLYFESDDENPKKKHKKGKKNKADKFGLKEYSGISDFSKWLLSFKKDDVEKRIKKEEKAARKKIIEDNARKSVTKSSAIISEPLAEILASQGHLDDAKKMYEQLMHKYPEKSSYFAAKINNLIKI
jgi:hypothetical protein